MTLVKRNWAFSLMWINSVVGIVILIQIAVNHVTSVRDLLHMLVYALVYANLTGVLGILAFSGLAERLALRKFRWFPWWR